MYIKDIIYNFKVYGSFLKATYNNIGHINSTYIFTMNQAGAHIRYVLQRVNKDVFKSPEIIMKNIDITLSHFKKKTASSFPRDYSRRYLTLIKTVDNKSYLELDGYIWRMFFYIEGTNNFTILKYPEQAEIVGESFGQFQAILSDLDTNLLEETIEGFHDGRSRLAKFKKSLKEDKVSRAKTCQDEIEWVLNYSSDFEVFPSLIESKKIPIRITHNDTKISNILLDKQSGEGVCVIDLDTVMPGIVNYDFGDMLRTSTPSEIEDSTNFKNVKMDFTLFQALSQGYLRSSSEFITQTEIDYLPFSGVYLTLELVSRFLTDYLDGDIYFKTEYEEHNLNRAKNQIALTESFKKNESKMQDYINKILKVRL